MENEKLRVFIRNWFIAGTAAAVARTCTAPLDRIKMLLQTQAMSPQFRQLGVRPYKNFWDCVRRIPREQGVLSLWRGNGVSVVRYIPSVAFSFAFNDLLKSYLLHDGPQRHKQIERHMLCGALAGTATHTLIHPLALSHTYVSTDIASPRRYSGLAHCLRDTYVSRGVRGLYAGYLPAVLGVSAYRSTYFGLFDSCKYYVDTYYGKRVPFIVALTLAQVVTFFASLIAYPFDTITRNRQIILLSAKRGENVSLANTVSELTKTRGYSVLYKGALINGMRSLCGAMVIVGYDEIQYIFFTSDDQKKKAFMTHRYHQFWRMRYPNNSDQP